jgi:DNA-binding XRE family transcriptional regulator
MRENRIRELRTAAKLTQERLAERIGLTHSAVCLHETHKRGIPPLIAVRYCTVFGVESIYVKS